MSQPWELMFSAKAVVFTETLPRRERKQLIALLERLGAHPVAASDDLPRQDGRGRSHYLRFVEGYAVLFWIDHAERVVNVMEIGRQ